MSILHDLYREAQERIEAGESPENLVHFIGDDPRRGLSSGITDEEFARGGYISRYYRLGYFTDVKVAKWILL